MLSRTFAIACAFWILGPVAAQAYIGPGMGLGLIASTLGLLAAFLMAMVALIWFPMKRMLARKKAQAGGPEDLAE